MINDSNYGASGGSVAVFVGIVVGSTVSTVLVRALMVFGIHEVKSKHLLRRNNGTRSSTYTWLRPI